MLFKIDLVMIRLNVLLGVFAFGFFGAQAFDDYKGYLDCRHKFGLGFEFHPLPVTLFIDDTYWGSAYANPTADGLVLPVRFDNLPSTGDDYIDVPKFTLRASDYISYSFNYEYLISDYSSFGVDFIFRSSNLVAEHNNTSWLYPEYSYGTVDFANVRGFDLRLKYRHYLPKFSKTKAPNGVYVDYVLSLPYTATQYLYANNGMSEHSSGLGGGIGIGKQGLLFEKVTYNYGVATIFNMMTTNESRYLVNYLLKDLEGNLYKVDYLQEPLKQPGVYQSNNSNFFSFYFRIGYLIF